MLSLLPSLALADASVAAAPDDAWSLIGKVRDAAVKGDVAALRRLADPVDGLWLWEEVGAGGPMPLRHLGAGPGGDRRREPRLSEGYFPTVAQRAGHALRHRSIDGRVPKDLDCGDDSRGTFATLRTRDLMLDAPAGLSPASLGRYTPKRPPPMRYRLEVLVGASGGLHVFLTERGGRLYLAHVMVTYCDV